ncbi:hypothetical protein [Burkholderia glumae]|nr:hypothetical protein [Burkholderia glumae]MCM2495443.1 hypothetical protein [Burkholderia glumae]MCM2546446.1 hypothetical protein [Burkholderia glumae]
MAVTGYDDTRRKPGDSLPAGATASVPAVAKSAGATAATLDTARPASR